MSTPAFAAACALTVIACAFLTAVLVRERRAAYQARHLFADPADITDPDGERYVAQLAGGGGRLPLPPPDPPPADTGVIPHAVGTWGKTVTQLADEMAATYLEAHDA